MKIKSLFKNSFFSLLSQLVLLLFGFLSQRAMNLYIGTELVGMNGVISNVIAMLSVTELGISTAIVYHLYSAIVHQDDKEIAIQFSEDGAPIPSPSEIKIIVKGLLFICICAGWNWLIDYTVCSSVYEK